MDTELARTFLVVIAAGSFVEASQRLHVTQSTVSTRIQRLEEQLGVELFVRNKAGTTLTAAGRQFQRHALFLTRAVEQARQELGSPSGFRTTLTVGARIAIWEGLLEHWLLLIAKLAPDIAIRAKLFGFEEDLMEVLIDGRADIGVMYTPQSRPGLTIEPLFEDRLVMVSTREQPSTEPGRDYVYVDWGSEFLAHHTLAFPNFSGAALSVNAGWLALHRILASQGSGYFPLRSVREYELQGRLHRVTSAPEFRLPVYLCYPTNMNSDAFKLGLDTIRRVVAETL